MSEKTYEVAHLDDLERLPVDEEGLVWRPVRRRLGIRAFGTNAYTAENAGDRVVEEHAEREHEELYFVARGHATFTLDGTEVDAPRGTLVFARPGTKRGAIAREPGTTVLAFGAKPGAPHEISKWEATFAAFGYLRSGDEARARAEMVAAVEKYPDEWQGHYNAACLESLTGNGAAAIAYLRRAIELSPEAAELARTDTDFDAIRNDPEFPK